MKRFSLIALGIYLIGFHPGVHATRISPPPLPQEAVELGLDGFVELSYWLDDTCTLHIEVLESEPESIYDDYAIKMLRKTFTRNRTYFINEAVTDSLYNEFVINHNLTDKKRILSPEEGKELLKFQDEIREVRSQQIDKLKLTKPEEFYSQEYRLEKILAVCIYNYESKFVASKIYSVNDDEKTISNVYHSLEEIPKAKNRFTFVIED